MQRQEAEAAAEEEAAGGVAAVLGQGAPADSRPGTELPLYNSHELEILRRAQRAFRAHLRTQAEAAEEILDATMKTTAMAVGEAVRRTNAGGQGMPGRSSYGIS